MRVLITGANGFVGRHLLERCGLHQLIKVARHAPAIETENWRAVGDFTQFDQWESLFESVEVIIHLAARVHQMHAADAIAYDRDNHLLVGKLVDAAIAQGVKRFIFLSSIKASGEYLQELDPYAQSKAAAEAVLHKAAQRSQLEIVIIRPPLVYGPGVKANFQRLWQMAENGLPLPIASVSNRRDMVSVFNLCDLIERCISHPAARNKTFNVSDGSPYSLAQLIVAMRSLMGLPVRLFPCPVNLLRWILYLGGGRQIAQRLLDNLEVDISETCALLDWQPKYSLQQTLEAMIELPSDVG